MTVTRKRNLLLLVFLQCLFPACAQWVGAEFFKLEKDNRTIGVHCIGSDNNGIMLLGTSNGLYRFDGQRFTPIPFNNPEYTDTVTALHTASDRTIWAGFLNGRLAKVVDHKLVYYNPEEGTPSKKITAFATDSGKNIWYATAGEGLYFIHNGRQYLVNEQNGLDDLHVNSICATANGDILAGTDQGMYICRRNGNKVTATVMGTREGLPDYLVTSIVPIDDNRFIIGMQEKGICIYDHRNKSIELPASVAGWEMGQVNAVLPLGRKIWITTGDHGLIRMDLESGQLDTSRSTIAGKTLTAAWQDAQGNVWLNSADNGLVRTGGEKFQLLPIPGNPVFEHVHALWCEPNGIIWTNDRQNRLLKLENHTGKLLATVSLTGVSDKTDITSLYQDKTGNLWIGTMGKGLFVMDPVVLKYRPFTENPRFVNAGVLSVSGKGNEIWVSSLQGTMKIELTSTNNSLPGTYQFQNLEPRSTGTNYIYAIFTDSRNRTWFATDGNGLTMLQNGAYTYYNENSGLKDKHIFSVVEDNTGNIWFSTSSAGLYKFDGKRFVNYGLQEGLSEMDISVLKKDPLGNIIIVHQKGLDVLDPATGTFSYINRNQGVGMINAEDLGAVAQDSAGNVMVNTPEGILTVVLPQNSQRGPKVIIETVELFLNQLNDQHKRVFDHDENNFTFRYAGLYYSDPDQVYYQYKLEGLDTNWVITKDRSKNFPKLEPGKYTFRIRASINKQFASADEAVYQFEIRKPFYANGWFILLCSLTATGLLIWYMRSRENALKKMERLRQEKIRFQFETLRTQVNPHFLFNSFNTLISGIEEDPKKAVAYAGKLSDFFRDVVSVRDKDTISLGEELVLLRNYFALQQQRYGSSLQLIIDVSDLDADKYKLPPLTLQLLTENAIKHNAISKDKNLQISIGIVNGEMLLVSNNINPRVSKAAGTGMGLQNINNRFNLLTNRKIKVKQDQHTFIVSLPLLKNHEP